MKKGPEVSSIYFSLTLFFGYLLISVVIDPSFWQGTVSLMSRLGTNGTQEMPKIPAVIEVNRTPPSFSGQSGKQPLRFLVQGGLHGDEASTPKFVRWLAARYQKGTSFLNNLDPWGIAIDFLPVANPVGASRGQRLNQRGVNLNRNFPVLWGLSHENPGNFPLSESETQAIAGLVRDRQYVAAVDIHGYVSWIVGPSYPHEIQRKWRQEMPGEIQFSTNDRRPFDRLRTVNHRFWMDALLQEVGFLKGYELHTAASLGDGGAFEDWAYWQMGVFAFCLEMAVPLAQDTLDGYGKDSKHHLAITPQDEVRLIQYELLIAKMFMHAISISRRSPVLGITQDSNRCSPQSRCFRGEQTRTP